MVQIDRLHDAIDEIFRDRKQSEKIIFYVMPFLVFAFLSYQFFVPISEKKILDKKTKLQAVKTEIKATQEYLKRKNEIFAEIGNIKEVNKALQTKLQNQINKNTQLQNSLLSIDFINMNEKNSIDFIDDIAVSSAKHGVIINSMETSAGEKKDGIFKKNMHIAIDCNGGFRGILAFVNGIENSKMFTKIDKLTLSHGKTLQAKIDITVSGL